MIDFTSALYLGLTHPAWSLRPWAQLTTGRPAALGTTAAEMSVARALAALTGCEAASLRSSTLHAFWDVFGTLGTNSTILVDAGAYPIAQWGAQRAAARGTAIRIFEHYDADGLRRTVGRMASRLRPVVVADGFCPLCGRPAPVEHYVHVVEERGGWLVLDDTQPLGILGKSPSASAPYGHGGGGSLQFQNVTSRHVLLVSSLAKAFGVPVAMLAGTATMIRSLEQQSETRVHTSPPSAAVIHAAMRAVEVNAAVGDVLRARLRRAVAKFRSLVSAAGMRIIGGLFPVQTVLPVRGVDSRRLYDRLLRSGVRGVLRRSRHPDGTVMLLITARHTMHELRLAAHALACAIREDLTVEERGGS
jgi:8-amino-7-oxononanoate synthase